MTAVGRRLKTQPARVRLFACWRESAHNRQNLGCLFLCRATHERKGPTLRLRVGLSSECGERLRGRSGRGHRGPQLPANRGRRRNRTYAAMMLATNAIRCYQAHGQATRMRLALDSRETINAHGLASHTGQGLSRQEEREQRSSFPAAASIRLKADRRLISAVPSCS